MRNKKFVLTFLSLTILTFVLVMSGCSAKTLKNRNQRNNKDILSSQNKKSAAISII